MDSTYVIGIVVVAAIGIVYGATFFKKKIKVAKLESVSTKAYDIAEMFLNANVFDFNNNTKKQIELVKDIAHDISNFVVVELTDEDVNKSELSVEAIKQVLDKLNISPSVDELKLIDSVIDEIIKLIDKK